MYRKIFPLVILSLAAAAVMLLPPSEGLECFSCWSEDSQTPETYKRFPSYGIPGHSSCAKRRIPDSNLTKICLPAKGPLGREMQPVCVQFYVQFLSHETPSSTPVEYKVAFRSCFYADPIVDANVTTGESCTSKTQKEVEAIPRGGPLGVILKPFYKSPTNLTAEFCNCNEDKCAAPLVPERDTDIKSDPGNGKVSVENDKGPIQNEGPLPVPEGIIRTTVTAHISVTDKAPQKDKDEGRGFQPNSDAEATSFANGSKPGGSNASIAGGNGNCNGGSDDDDQANSKCGSSASWIKDGKLSFSVWATIVAFTMVFFHCSIQ